MNSDESFSDENNEQSIINKIKKDLQHEVNNNTKFTSPFEGYKDYKTFKNIIYKIEQLGKHK
ncbi:7569_t:CDS:2, partial [Scutellospora calospora]